MKEIKIQTKEKKKTIEEQLREFLMSSDGFIPIEEARKEAERKWPRSKN